MSLGKVIDLKKIVDPRGNLTVVEGRNDVPFEIRRVYWVYDVPSGESRGGHAHRQCNELLVAASGSFVVTLTDGRVRQTYLLNHPYQALLIEKNIWRTLDDFCAGAVCLVMASEEFDESDYIRDFDEYKQYVGCLK